MTNLAPHNPFSFTKPIPTSKFIGREYELQSLPNKLLNGESYIITGQPRIGKSSLLHKVASVIVERNTDNKTCIPVVITSAFIDSRFNEEDFWRNAITSIGQAANVKLAGTSGHFVEFANLANLLAAENKQVVLLLDGLGWLLDKVGFGFWSKLRSIVQSSNINFAAFSRLNFRQIYERTTAQASSPFLSILFHHTLLPFSEKQTYNLIETYSENRYFTPKDKRVIWQFSGGHPFLVQLSSSAIWEKRIDSRSISKDGYDGLIHEILDVADAHLWDTWRYLSPSEQTIGLMVSIRDLGQIGNFDVSDLDTILEHYRMHLHTLEQTGLVRIADKRIYLSSLCFGLWIIRNQVLGREAKDPNEFLRENLRVAGLITNKQLDSIISSAMKILSSFKNTAISVVDIVVRSRLGLPPV